MISWSGLAILHLAAAVGQPGAEDLNYETALRRSTVSGRPLVIFVTADWCAACQRMKATTLPELQRKGDMRDVEFAVVDFDRQRELAAQLVQGGPIPQLVRYDQRDRKWFVRRLIGAQNLTKVTQFFTADLAALPGRSRAGGQSVRETERKDRSADQTVGRGIATR